MQMPNWNRSTIQRLPAENGSSACFRNQRTTGSSAWLAMKPIARSMNGEGGGERERPVWLLSALLCEYADEALELMGGRPGWTIVFGLDQTLHNQGITYCVPVS